VQRQLGQGGWLPPVSGMIIALSLTGLRNALMFLRVMSMPVNEIFRMSVKCFAMERRQERIISVYFQTTSDNPCRCSTFDFTNMGLRIPSLFVVMLAGSNATSTHRDGPSLRQQEESTVSSTRLIQWMGRAANSNS
jgi:hypothetical protein